MQHPLDLNGKKLYDYANEYPKQIGLEFDGTKLMKIPTGYYDSPASLGKYLEKEFAKNLPIKYFRYIPLTLLYYFLLI